MDDKYFASNLEEIKISLVSIFRSNAAQGRSEIFHRDYIHCRGLRTRRIVRGYQLYALIRRYK